MSLGITPYNATQFIVEYSKNSAVSGREPPLVGNSVIASCEYRPELMRRVGQANHYATTKCSVVSCVYADPNVPAVRRCCCDLVLVVVCRLGRRSQHYRTAVTIYTMLLANCIGASRSYLFLCIGL